MVVRMPGPHRVGGIAAGAVIRYSRHRSDLLSFKRSSLYAIAGV